MTATSEPFTGSADHRAQPLVAFFALAYAFTWIPVAIVLAAMQARLVAQDSPISALVGRLIGFGPAIAAIIVTGMVAGRA